MADSTEVRELFRRSHHPKLQDTVQDIEFRDDLDGIGYLEAEITSHPLYPRCQINRIPERFPEFSPVETTVGATVAAEACVKVAVKAAASIITRRRSIQAITRIGKA